MMERITKEQLLQGTAAVEDFPVTKMGGNLVTLRPISGREWLRLSTKRMKSLESGGAVQKNQRTGEVKFDLEAITQNNFLIKCETIALAMLEPKLTSEEVASMKLDVITEIYGRIRVISGLDPDTAEEIKTFRAKPGGASPGEGSDEIPAGSVVS